MSSQRKQHVAVLGAGLMGTRIALLLAQHGHRVTVYDAREVNIAAHDLIQTCGSVKQAVEGADLIVEAIFENLDAKHRLYAEVEAAPTTAPIASNTSTFLPSQLADGLTDRSRLLVAHFFNPADIVPLVELVPSPDTAPQALAMVSELLEGVGKTVVPLRREVPGFIANRLQAAVAREALHLVEIGVADEATVDDVMTTSLGPRWSVAGPLRTMDAGGLDVWRAVCEQLFPHLSNAENCSAQLVALAEDGMLGAKTGQGFYEWDDESIRRHIEGIRAAFLPGVTAHG